MKLKIRDFSRTHDIIHGDCGKNFSVFRNFIMHDVYKWKHLRKRIRDSKRMQLGLD